MSAAPSDSVQKPVHPEAPSSGRVALVAGEVSGIQRYLGEAAARGTGRAGKRLRFRSFLVQAVTQAAAFQLLHGLPDGRSHLLLDAGGHFLLEIPVEVAEARVAEVRAAVEATLLERTEGVVRLHIVWRAVRNDRDAEVEMLLQALRSEKRRPLFYSLTSSGAWDPGHFQLPKEWAGGHPCDLCGMPRAITAGGECRDCSQESGIGAQISTSDRWCVGPAIASRLRIATWGVRPLASHANASTGEYLVSRLPVNSVVGDFEQLASRSPGAPLLAYVKADGDGIGALFSGTPLSERQRFSLAIDRFFREWLDELPASVRDRLYLVYGGGDDIFFVGPWDAALEVSVLMSTEWSRRINADRAVGMSCGIAIHHPHFPLAYAMDSAEDALLAAKRHGNCINLLGESLTWSRAREVGRLWRELQQLLEHPDGMLPTATLRVLLDHIPPLNRRPANVFRDYCARRSSLAYALSRNVPPSEYPEAWELLGRYLAFEGGADEYARWMPGLQVLRVACQLALWASREQEDR